MYNSEEHNAVSEAPVATDIDDATTVAHNDDAMKWGVWNNAITNIGIDHVNKFNYGDSADGVSNGRMEPRYAEQYGSRIAWTSNFVKHRPCVQLLTVRPVSINHAIRGQAGT